MANLNNGNLAFRDTHKPQSPQSTFGFSRRARPPLMQFSTSTQNDARVPLGPKNVDRRASRIGLRGMFSRTKGQEDKCIVSPVMEESPPISPASETLRDILPNTIPLLPPIPVVPMRPASRASRINLRSSRSAKQTQAPPKESSKHPKLPPQVPGRTSTAWDPPPLFQAYPQAVKLATLSALSLSADAILRMNESKKIISQAGAEENGQAIKTNKAKIKHRRQISDSMSKAEWTRKIFILVTSGYLLQYAGDGSFDRLPEKMMQLGKDSVAFASDAIPGRHWVLQVSQAMDADGSHTPDPKSLLSRLAFRSTDNRRTVTSLLLVYDSPAEMDSWLAVLRREIESLGGKKHASETGKPKPDEKLMQLKQPSHRLLVQRDPDQYSGPSSPQSLLISSPWVSEKQSIQELEDSSVNLTKHQFEFVHQNTEDRSIANSIVSYDGRQLDSLRRDSGNHLSFMSSGQRTLMTSHGSSQSSSPTRESYSTIDENPHKDLPEGTPLKANGSAIKERRRSMQTPSLPTLDTRTPSKYRPHSTFGGPSRPIRAHSPTTPNFSIPKSPRFPNYTSPQFPDTVQAERSVPDIVTARHSLHKQGGMQAKTLPPIPSDKRRLSLIRDSMPVLAPTKPAVDIQCVESQLNNDIISYRLSTNATPRSTNHRSSMMPLSPLVSFSERRQPPRRYSIQTETKTFEQPNYKRSIPPKILSPPSSPLDPPASENALSHNSTIIDIEKELFISTRTKLRRPASMQISISSVNHTHHTSKPKPTSSTKSSSLPSTRNTRHSIAYKPPQAESSKRFSPSRRPDLPRADSKTLTSMKSMPSLSSGPPPAPPPDCALPPLPPPTIPPDRALPLPPCSSPPMGALPLLPPSRNGSKPPDFFLLTSKPCPV